MFATQLSVRSIQADPPVEMRLLANKAKDDSSAADEEVGGTLYSLPEDKEVSDDQVDDDDLPRRLRLYRKFRLSEHDRWGRPVNAAMYVLYLFVVALITSYNVDDAQNQDERNNYYLASRVGYGLYQALILVHVPTFFMGRRTLYAWGGLFRVGMSVALNCGSIAFFAMAFSPDVGDGYHPFQNYLLLFMAFSVFFDQQIVEPVFKQLCQNFQGAISDDEIGKVKPVSGISNRALVQVARNSAKAVGVSDAAIEAVATVLEGQRVRSDPDEALDDWTLAIYKLSKVVALIPICAKDSNMTSGQYRNLVNQMILYMRAYMETGKVGRDEYNLTRSAPLSFFESFAQMTKFSLMIPCTFFVALIPRSLFMINQVSVMSWAVGRFTAGVMAADRNIMIQGFSVMIASNAAIPILGFLQNTVESRYSSRLVDRCRRKMLASTVKGGTAFDEAYPSGRLVDAFSNHLAQLEIYTQYQFVTFFPQLVALISGMITVARAYAFAAILFVSLIPVIVSVDFFTKRATAASNKKGHNDGNFMGKVASAVGRILDISAQSQECSAFTFSLVRRAIRAGNAGTWVEDDMEDLLSSTYETHRASFFSSTLVENFTQTGGSFYTVVVLIPLGIKVIQDPSTFPSFMTIVMALGGLIMPIYVLGVIQNQTSQFSASIKTARDLMRHDLDEEPPSQASEPKNTLGKLTNSVKIEDIKFRYSEKLPDVIKGVSFDITKGASFVSSHRSKKSLLRLNSSLSLPCITFAPCNHPLLPVGTYNVLCGGSGSGKTTVLNLLMRFREPYAGGISWDGSNIYNSSLDSFREHVSVMFQQTMIYMGSVRDNILFGLPEVPGAVEKAAQDAEIDHFIRALPAGYDTIIGGDATGGMSGGQLQRVCLARALYRKPSILLLDEATSALDNETEHAIIQTLVNLRDNEGLTLVSVSHHPSTAVKADNIVMLEHGVIAEEGTYNDLVTRDGGLFRRLVEAGEED
ncbi:hypothetical protein ACHAWF_014100 [Thalassiosira exigua]